MVDNFVMIAKQVLEACCLRKRQTKTVYCIHFLGIPVETICVMTVELWQYLVTCSALAHSKHSFV